MKFKTRISIFMLHFQGMLAFAFPFLPAIVASVVYFISRHKNSDVAFNALAVIIFNIAYVSILILALYGFLTDLDKSMQLHNFVIQPDESIMSERVSKFVERHHGGFVTFFNYFMATFLGGIFIAMARSLMGLSSFYFIPVKRLFSKFVISDKPVVSAANDDSISS